jgi:hypothetical protein
MTEGIRAITVRQPWARAILFYGKNIENRGSGFSKRYRGPLLIHAAGAWSERGALDTRVRAARNEVLVRAGGPGSLGPVPPSGVRSAIIGVVDVVDAHAASGCCEPWGERTYTGSDGKDVLDVTHLVLERPRLLRHPVPCSGRLGLWTPPADVLAEVTAQLGAL